MIWSKNDFRFTLIIETEENMSAFLTGQLLVAMPQMDDKRFRHTVLLICSHDENAAMGVIVNQPREDLHLSDLAEQLGIGTPRFNALDPIYNGGPMEQSRGIVIHSSEHMLPDSLTITPDMGMTSNIKILSEIANGYGPSDYLIALGHASWTGGQLERELHDNVWLTMPYEADLVFDQQVNEIWSSCFSRLGIATAHLSPVAGNA
jgi:putative transcriptional regulator